MNQFVYEGHKTYRVRGIGVAAVAVVCLAALAYLANLALYWAITITGRAANGDVDQLDTTISLENLLPYAGLGVGLAQIVAVVLTMIWLWRARKNLDAFPDTQPVLSPGWAIGGWFLPIANLVVPGRMVANVARQSVREGWVSAVAVIWWVALVLATVADRLAGVVQPSQTDDVVIAVMDNYLTISIILTVSVGAAVIAAVAFAVAVPRISGAQEERIHRGWYEEQNRTAVGA
ncbi:DUF4328 domain-containing protein [Asanoa sp. WMMD1127]|uniref:DUF4328 domain-containing protein n=1 Tax=Asanoa sp. WMMD1127 TaxID=3016107 RepID=UPI0024159E40|nr:DUF4328 domain-containing protein [Asanoa sp. WMMD1127]MDG4820980.1 DUF4328 domain-containing protein [Asanoa sp. WMMD1127]